MKLIIALSVAMALTGCSSTPHALTASEMAPCLHNEHMTTGELRTVIDRCEASRQSLTIVAMGM